MVSSPIREDAAPDEAEAWRRDSDGGERGLDASKAAGAGITGTTGTKARCHQQGAKELGWATRDLAECSFFNRFASKVQAILTISIMESVFISQLGNGDHV